MSDVRVLSRQLLDRLVEQLPALSTQWQTAGTVTPRHLFIPDEAECEDNAGNSFPINKTLDVNGWLEAAYSDSIIVTQRDGNGYATSSASLPYMVFSMLEHLDIQPGNNVLEIGTGTGWSAALMASQLGERRVHTVEVDEALAETARANLAKLGLVNVKVITGDGVEGWEPAAPYDRVISTAAAHRVPYAWVSQSNAGGLIVTPWDTTLGLGALVVLTVDDDGTASGQLVDTASFMWLRSQKFTPLDEPDDFAERADVSKVSIDLPAARGNLARFAVGLVVPDCKAYGFGSDGPDEIWFCANDSWACVDAASGKVQQLGSRRLWDEIESAYSWWTEAGTPDLERFGMTVTPECQVIWLDSPDNIISRTTTV